jgi:hypothetical protein
MSLEFSYLSSIIAVGSAVLVGDLLAVQEEKS